MKLKRGFVLFLKKIGKNIGVDFFENCPWLYRTSGILYIWIWFKKCWYEGKNYPVKKGSPDTIGKYTMKVLVGMLGIKYYTPNVLRQSKLTEHFKSGVPTEVRLIPRSVF